MDAFVDHEEAFLRYLDAQEANATGESLGLYLREVHSIHSKVKNSGFFHRASYRFEIEQRVGIPFQWSQKLPNLSKEEFYDLCKFVLKV